MCCCNRLFGCCLIVQTIAQHLLLLRLHLALLQLLPHHWQGRLQLCLQAWQHAALPQQLLQCTSQPQRLLQLCQEKKMQQDTPTHTHIWAGLARSHNCIVLCHKGYHSCQQSALHILS